MNRRKINPEVRPQDDTVMLLQRKQTGFQSHHNLLPGHSKNKKKGTPISIPNHPISHPKITSVSIDKCDASRFYVSDTKTSTKSRPTRLGNLKKADESKRKPIQKSHGSGKETAVLVSDDEDRRINYDILGTGRKETTSRKPLMFGIPSSSSNTRLSLNKKRQALGPGRSTQSSQSHQLLLPSTKKRHHSFLQNYQRDDISRSLPYRWEEQERPPAASPINQHRRFEPISDENSGTDNDLYMKKRKTAVYKTTATTTITPATTTPTFNAIDPMDISDNDEVYHSASSISSDSKKTDKNNGNNDTNTHTNTSTTNSTLKHNNTQKQLVNFIQDLDSSHPKDRSLNMTTKKNQNRLSPPLLSPTPSAASSPPSPSSSATKEAIKTSNSPAPVELSDDEMDEAHNTLFTYPTIRTKGSITVTLEDQKRLEPDQFLNDTIIAFYLKYLMDSYSTPNGYRNYNEMTRTATENTHIFSSFFYNRLTAGSGQTKRLSLLRKKPISYENVRKWTSKIDLFSKKYAIFPINENWHWYLTLVCNLDKCIPEQTNGDPTTLTASEKPHIFVLDSLGNMQRDTMANINQYLKLEAQHRRNVDPSDFVQPQVHYAKVPKQDNTCDCGVFLLHFVDQFLNSPQHFIRILLERDGQHSKWKEDEIKDKRMELKTLFRKIHRQYSIEHGSKAII